LIFFVLTLDFIFIQKIEKRFFVKNFFLLKKYYTFAPIKKS